MLSPCPPTCLPACLHANLVADWQVDGKHGHAQALARAHPAYPLTRSPNLFADWQIDGEDLVAAIRTSWDGARDFHDSNRITFKRIKRYRRYLPSRAPHPANCSC